MESIGLFSRWQEQSLGMSMVIPGHSCWGEHVYWPIMKLFSRSPAILLLAGGVAQKGWRAKYVKGRLKGVMILFIEL